MNEYTLHRHVANLIGSSFRSWEPAPPEVRTGVDAIKRRGVDLPSDTEEDALVSAHVAIALHPEHVVTPPSMTPALRLQVVGGSQRSTRARRLRSGTPLPRAPRAYPAGPLQLR